jgi:hypothetical protein
VTQILVALTTAAGVVVLGWLLVSGKQVLSRMRRSRSAAGHSSVVDAPGVRNPDWIYGDRAASERRAQRTPSEPGEANQKIPPQVHEPSQTLSAKGKAEAILRDAELKAAEILAGAEKDRESLLEQTRVSAEQTVLEIKEKAEREAAAIVKNAELKAGEALIGVERARARLEQEMQEVAREQARMAAKHEKLSEFLLTALEEIERATGKGSATRGGLQELRDELRSTE